MNAYRKVFEKVYKHKQFNEDEKATLCALAELFNLEPINPKKMAIERALFEEYKKTDDYRDATGRFNPDRAQWSKI